MLYSAVSSYIKSNAHQNSDFYCRFARIDARTPINVMGLGLALNGAGVRAQRGELKILLFTPTVRLKRPILALGKANQIMNIESTTVKAKELTKFGVSAKVSLGGPK